VSSWHLECSACDTSSSGSSVANVCKACGQPLLVRYSDEVLSGARVGARWDMWRYRSLLPILNEEEPISLGEGLTPLHEIPSLADSLGVRRVWVKDESLNPTGSFKARGMSAAVTRARAHQVPGLVAPTAGNAGAALAAYGAAASIPVRVYAPRTTPAPILNTIRSFGARLELVEGHIGDAGRLARAFAAESGYLDVSTLREPYRVEGKKTMGVEIAEQLGWKLPTHIVYPTGGGTGLIGMWKVFGELTRAGLLPADIELPRMVVAQATGCAPIVKAFESDATTAVPWESPETHASGLRVPAPLGDRLILRALRESGGHAAAATEEEIRTSTEELAAATGIDAAPEGGCALAVARLLCNRRLLKPSDQVVIFNTGSGVSYRT
jgi:threonine synthase